MKNVLLFACLAGVAAAVAIYFVTENNKNDEGDFITDVDVENYDLVENTGFPAI